MHHNKVQIRCKDDLFGICWPLIRARLRYLALLMLYSFILALPYRTTVLLSSNILLSLVDVHVHYLQSSFFMMVPDHKRNLGWCWWLGRYGHIVVWHRLCSVFWPWRWWRHVDNDPTISVASRACFLLLAQTGGCAVAGPNIGTVTRYKVPVLPITPSPASPARLTYDIFSQHYYTATTSPILCM